MEFLTSSIGPKSNQLPLLKKPVGSFFSKIIAADFTLRTPCRVRCRMNAYWIRKAVSCNLPHATSSSSPSPSPEEQRRRPHFRENVGRQANAKVPSTTLTLSPSSSELIGSLKLGKVWVFVQLIHRQMRTRTSCKITQTLTNLRLLISSDHHINVSRGRREHVAS